MSKYRVKIWYTSDPDSTWFHTFETDNIEWTMDQYQRNRPPLRFEVK